MQSQPKTNSVDQATRSPYLTKRHTSRISCDFEPQSTPSFKACFLFSLLRWPTAFPLSKTLTREVSSASRRYREASLRSANSPFQAQTDAQEPSADISADDFLAREKAVLGADADQFATKNDFTHGEPGNDLLGEGDAAQSTFESQFPDLASPSAVSWRASKRKAQNADGVPIRVPAASPEIAR